MATRKRSGTPDLFYGIIHLRCHPMTPKKYFEKGADTMNAFFEKAAVVFAIVEAIT